MKATDRVYPESYTGDELGGLTVRDYIAIHSQDSVTAILVHNNKDITQAEMINKFYERADAMIAASNEEKLTEWPCQQLHGGTGSAIYMNTDGMCTHPECNPIAASEESNDG